MQQNVRDAGQPGIEHLNSVRGLHLQTMLSRLQQEHETNPTIFGRVSFLPGQKFISQSEPDTAVYLLLRGKARVSKIDEQGVSHDLAVLSSPTIVGELSALSQGRTADVSAESEVEAITLDASVLREMCYIYPDFARSFTGLVNQRFAETEKITESSDRDDQIHAMAKMKALAFATPENQRGIITALIDFAKQHPHVLKTERYLANTQEPFIKQGQALDRVYVIVEGEAEVHLPDGRAIRVGLGSPLGEISALSATGVATASVFFPNDIEVLSISRENFQALRGPAEALVTERINQMFTRPLPPEVKETLRSIRDQNLDALILRTALDIAHSTTGIFKDLNPDQVVLGGITDHTYNWSIIRQKCTIMQSVGSLLKLGKTRTDIASVIEEIRQYNLKGIPALKMFKGEAALLREDWVEGVASIYKPYLPEALTLEEFTAVRERFELIRWLDELLLRDGAITQSLLPGKDALDKLCMLLQARESAVPANIFEDIDDMFVELMEAGLTRGSKHIADDLMTVKFQKVQARLAGEALPQQPELPPDHMNYRALHETRERLSRGERSAIGGTDYATQRFPTMLLNRIVEGKVKVVVFDGTRNAGIAYVTQRFAPSSHILGVQPKYMTTEVQGLDGAGGRTLITFKEGEAQVLLLTGYGAARQRHNGASVLLYELSGKRIPEENLILACEGISYVNRMRTDIRRALEAEASKPLILGEPVNHTSIPTQLLILQNPKEFETALTGPDKKNADMSYASGAMFDFYISYARDHAGIITRYIIPKVGGKGLYGETAGDFVEACFTVGIIGLSNDIIFNGTAGGFDSESPQEFITAGGLGEVKPGESVICPLHRIAQYEGRGKFTRMKMVTLFGGFEGASPKELEARRLFETISNTVCFTSDHVAVGAPGDETYDLIRELVALGFTSIDVEAGSIMRAVEKLNENRNESNLITFTPLYTFSDNPLRSEHDRYDSLAIMGPFFEGARFNVELWDALKSILAFVQQGRENGLTEARV
jgi:CRP-like cAMP-binding protein